MLTNPYALLHTLTMATRGRTGQIQRFILDQVETHGSDITQRVAQEYGISRQAVNRHLQSLESRGAIVGAGATRAREWKLSTGRTVTKRLRVTPIVTDERLWHEYARPLVDDLPANVREICQFGFTGAVANVIDHADAGRISVSATRSPASIDLSVTDDGTGLFGKLIRAFGFDDAHTAVFELSKGRLTTDPGGHSGGTLFLASRMFSLFEIQSAGRTFSYDGLREVWSSRPEPFAIRGTSVRMRLVFSRANDMDEVIDWYTTGNGRILSRMHVHVALLQREGDTLLTRTQGLRLLDRLDGAEEALLDFRGVETIGPSFADEVFRVFRTRCPDTTLVTLNAGPGVRARIHDVLSKTLHVSPFPPPPAPESTRETQTPLRVHPH